MLTGSGATRLAPFCFASAPAAATASLPPEMTICPGQLSFASTTGGCCWADTSAHTARNVSASNPSTAAMLPGARSPASFISHPRSRTIFTPSSKLSAPAAHRALNSPRLCPATKAGASTSPDSSMVASAAMLCVKIAGCVLKVSPSAVSGPSKHNCVRPKPSAASARSKMPLATGRRRARSLPIPTNCDPWPGKTYAVVMLGIQAVKAWMKHVMRKT